MKTKAATAPKANLLRPHQQALAAMDAASLSKITEDFNEQLARQPMDDDDDDGDHFEHGDMLANRHVDPSDFSVHQFLASDEARGVAGSEEEQGDSDGDDGATAELARRQAEAKNNDFGSEDTPE